MPIQAILVSLEWQIYILISFWALKLRHHQNSKESWNKAIIEKSFMGERTILAT